MKTLFPFKIFITSIFVLGVAMTNAFANRELLISPEQQSCNQPDGNGTCWAACCNMVLNAYSYSTTQAGIVNWAVNNTCSDNAVSNTCSGNYIEGTCTAVDMVLQNFGPIGTNPDYGNLSQSDLIAEIDDLRPIIAHWQYSDHGHDLLIKGYSGTGGSGGSADVGNVIYNDPFDGTRKQKSFAEFVQTGNYPKWDETLRLTTDPRTPIPSGFDDWMRISNGGTTTITPSTTSLSYTAIFHETGSPPLPPSHPVSWNWKLIFVHSGGNCIARSWTSTSTDMQLTWNISGFSLPSGYQWCYNYNGKIPGRVELDLLDSDGSHHLDAVDVMYVPNNLYPGIVRYMNKTISTSQPDVKAHELIITQNDQFNPGTNISLKSGERIDINDGITIQNGTVTNFIVDPTLR